MGQFSSVKLYIFVHLSFMVFLRPKRCAFGERKNLNRHHLMILCIINIHIFKCLIADKAFTMYNVYLLSFNYSVTKDKDNHNKRDSTLEEH